MHFSETFGSKNWIPVFTGMTLKERDCFVADGGSQWQERTHPVPSGHPSGQRGHFKVRELWSWEVNFRFFKILWTLGLL